MARTFLIAEDDVNIAGLLVRYFTKEGFETLHAANGADALTLARKRNPCFVILDLMLPGMHGWDVCEEIRAFSRVPILILSARQEEADRILGLNLGADDYVVKPFSPREVVARVHAILRRSEPASGPPNEILRNGELCLNSENRTVRLADKEINLTATEFVLLKTLMERPERVFTRPELLNHLYAGHQSVIDRVVDVHIAKIRHKIGSNSYQGGFIKTVRGVGYRLNA